MKKLTGQCPICNFRIVSDTSTEEPEIISCGDCQSRLVVETIKGSVLALQEAPKVEEDWGE